MLKLEPLEFFNGVSLLQVVWRQCVVATESPLSVPGFFVCIYIPINAFWMSLFCVWVKERWWMCAFAGNLTCSLNICRENKKKWPGYYLSPERGADLKRATCTESGLYYCRFAYPNISSLMHLFHSSSLTLTATSVFMLRNVLLYEGTKVPQATIDRQFGLITVFCCIYWDGYMMYWSWINTCT